jgi:ABC-type multidrug transport system fused ATPase/permease subunit
MTFAALLETAALGSVAFFASAVTDPDVVLSSRYVAYIKQLTNADFLNTSKGLILVASFLVIILITCKNSVKAIVTYWITRFGAGIEAYFGEIILNGVLTLPYQWHLTRNTADLVTAVNWRIYLGRSFFEPCLKIFNNVLMVAIMLTALFVIQPVVSVIIFMVLGSTAYFIYTVIKRQLDRISTKARDYQLAINKEITMAIHGIKDVKISQKENIFVLKFIKKVVPLAKILGIQNFYSASPVLILETIGFVMLCLAICIMLLWGKTSTAYATGTMALLAVTAWKALPAVNQILGSITTARNALPYISNEINYFTLIEADKTIKQNTTKQPLDFSETIKFNNVGFSYQDNTREVIHGLSFDIEKGQTIGIIGTSGAGKSTLVDLLIGLIAPVKGTIQIDDQELTSELLFKWLKITGYVSQSPYIYDGTLAENVAFGMNQADIDREQVRKCCTMASMDDFIHDLPDNIDSSIGERGIKLSGGQQQRVAIARALYSKPEVLIFDEATSSLDTKSEKAIQKTIYSFKGRQTLIIIAHRLTTVEDCDKVIWLEKGIIKMMGKPEEVLGIYNQGEIKGKLDLF